MKRICVIPAKGQSRRLPGKNIKEFRGRPVLAWAISHGLNSLIFDAVIVSTDSEEIAALAESLGAGVVRRDQEMTHDGIGTLQVTQHAAMWASAQSQDQVCCLYPTAAPLIKEVDLMSGRNLLTHQRGHHHAFTVGTEPLRDAGQWYWSRATALLNNVPLITHATALYPLAEDRFVDVNTAEDWRLMEEIYDRICDE